MFGILFLAARTRNGPSVVASTLLTYLSDGPI
jgi:hypothetical protein